MQNILGIAKDLHNLCNIVAYLRSQQGMLKVEDQWYLSSILKLHYSCSACPTHYQL